MKTSGEDKQPVHTLLDEVFALDTTTESHT